MEVISWFFALVFGIYGIVKLFMGLHFHDNPKAYKEYRKRQRQKDPTIWWEEQERNKIPWAKRICI